jgi:hypothetical protein
MLDCSRCSCNLDMDARGSREVQAAAKAVLVASTVARGPEARWPSPASRTGPRTAFEDSFGRSSRARGCCACGLCVREHLPHFDRQLRYAARDFIQARRFWPYSKEGSGQPVELARAKIYPPDESSAVARAVVWSLRDAGIRSRSRSCRRSAVTLGR